MVNDTKVVCRKLVIVNVDETVDNWIEHYLLNMFFFSIWASLRIIKMNEPRMQTYKGENCTDNKA